MSKQEEPSTGESLFYLVAVIIAVVILFVTVPKVWNWHVKNWQAFGRAISFSGDYYCSEVKKIVKADPVFEDNGKYEDEAYRVTYEDGAVGLADQAQMASGYYCVSEKFSDKPIDGWTLKP